MFKENKYQDTELEALQLERKEQDWQKNYGSKTDDYIAKIDQLLAEGTNEKRMQIKEMFMNQEFFEHYKQVDLFAIIYIVMIIYELEDNAKILPTILDQVNTVEELRDYMFQLKMILYRLDFDIDQDTEEEFLRFLKVHMVSPVQLEIMMNTSVMRPLPLALKLEEIFEKHNLDNYLYFILEFINNNWQGNYRIISKMADICITAGRPEQSVIFLNELPKIPSSYRAQEGTLFQVQQLLWKVMYQETDAEKETVLTLKNENVSNDMWQFLLEHVNVSEKEYYLGIVNRLLEYKFVEKTEITLKAALKIAPGDELILCLLAELAINEGEVERAEEYLSLIVEPGELTVKFQKLCERLKEKNGVE